MAVLSNICSKESPYWFLLYAFRYLGLWHCFPESWYLRLLFRCSVKEKLNLGSPRTFNEKLNWCKLYDRQPLYSTLADKYEVKKYVSDLIGPEYVVPCYGVWDDVSRIEWDALPESFILKCTFDSSGVYVCRNKDRQNKEKIVRFFGRLKNSSYYKRGLEWPYKDIKHRIIADMLLDDGRNGELQDYKWWCFNGEPKVMYITNKGKTGEVFENFYDMDFRPLDINHNFPRMQPEYQKPEGFEQMKHLAGILSKGMPFVRIDFFDIYGKIYFGEYTFYDHAGLRPFASKEWDNRLGEWINLNL